MFASQYAREVTGYSPEELTDGTVEFESLIVKEQQERVRTEARAALDSGERFEIQYDILRKDGVRRSVEDRGHGVYEGGRVVAIEGVIEDVTGREIAERRLREVEQRYRSVVENVPVITYMQVPEPGEAAAYATAYMSPQVEEVLGYPPQRFMQSAGFWDELIHAEDRARVLAEDERTDATGEPFHMEYRMLARDGQTVWVRDEAYLIQDSAGEPLYWQGVIADITRHKVVEEKLRTSEAELRALLAAVPDVILVLDEEVRYAKVAPTNPSLLAMRPEDLIGRSVHEVLPQDLADRFVEGIGQALATQQAVELDYALEISGSEVWFEGTLSPMAGDRVLLIARDVTERKTTMRALQEAEEKYRVLVERAPAVTYVETVVEGTGSASSYVSPQVEDLLGYEVERMNGSPPFWQVVMHPDDRERVMALDDHANRTGEPFAAEYRVVAADGRVLWVRDEAVLAAREPDGSQRWHGVMIDVTDRREAEEKLREAEDRFRTLVEQLPAVTYIDSATGSFESLYTSPQIEDMLGYTPQEWRADELWHKSLHPDDRERVLAADELLEELGEPFAEEYRLISREGSVVWVSERAVLVRDDAGEPRFWQGVLLDITERKKAEEALRRSQANLAEAQRMANIGSFEWDPGTGALEWSDEVFRIYGYGPGQFEPTFEKLLEIVHPDDKAKLSDLLDRSLRKGESYEFEHRIVRPDGAVRVVHRRAEVVRGEGGEALRMVGTVHDVTAHRALLDRLEYQSLHDPLTGLANRTLFTNRLEHALARAKRRNEGTAVLFLDLDDFKIVNDSLGHEMGDRLLVMVARRLQECLRPEDTAARLGGDEFVVLLEGAGGHAGAVRVAERIVQELRTPFVLGDMETFITASIGIVVDGAGKGPADMIRDADVAMYRAKRAGKARHAVFEETMNARAIERLEMGNDLRRAIDREEFVVHYQPKVLLTTGAVAGFEALLRWNHPKRGLIQPQDFIPLAEETGLVVPLGRWVTQEACRQLEEWRRRNPANPSLFVCVNLSARQFGDPYLAEATSRALRATGLPARSLLLEITETTAMGDAPSTVAQLEQLKGLGVQLAIDDFGTGYSSLSYLERFFVDHLKIDSSFVDGLGRDPGATVLVSGIIDLAHALGLEVIAEGVETEEQCAILKGMGCDLAQGFLFSRPLEAMEAEGLLVSVYDADRG